VPRKRRLQGIAALSAATLVTAGLAGTAIAADECADAACADEQVNLADLIEAISGDEIPEDALLKLADVYEQLGMGDLGEVFAKVEYDGSNPEVAFPKVEDAFPKIEGLDGLEGLIPEDALVEMQDALPMIEEALLKLGDSGEVDPAMLKMFLDMIPEDE
jgi:hypothetical protein